MDSKAYLGNKLVAWDAEGFIMQKAGGVSRIFADILSNWPADSPLNLGVFAGFHSNTHLRSIRSSAKVDVVARYVPGYFGRYRILHPADKIIFQALIKKRNPQLVHFTYVERTQRREAGRREIMTVHDMIYEKYPEYFPRNTVVPHLKRKLAESVDGIICVSNSTKSDMLNAYGISEDKVAVIYHGNPMEGVVPRSEGKPEWPYFIYVGRRSGYKNAKTLYEALLKAGDLKEFRLVLFGGESLDGEKNSNLDELRKTNRIVAVKGANDDLAGWYKNACALIYTSEYEGFGLPPLEAMSVGCPVIAARNPAVEETTGGSAMLYEPHSVDALMECMRAVASNQERRNALINAGTACAKKFSWKKCAAATSEFYLKIME